MQNDRNVAKYSSLHLSSVNTLLFVTEASLSDLKFKSMLTTFCLKMAVLTHLTGCRTRNRILS